MNADLQRPTPSPDDILAAAVQTLIEHFDSVRIVVTTHESGRSEMHTLGDGNVYAQIASVEEWLDMPKLQPERGDEDEDEEA